MCRALLGNELCHALPKSSSDSHHQDTKIPWRRSANGGSLVVMLRKHLKEHRSNLKAQPVHRLLNEDLKKLQRQS